MKRITTFGAALVLSALPALADEGNPSMDKGAELLREGFGLLLEGLTEEMAPLADGWQSFVDQLGDMSLYHAPEVLPNGDILIRRKTPLDPEVGEDGEVEL
ncbi:hypothetical protein [Aliiroseovarius subalbicans]|uniref:hypothetical protein n=1 Tax=Aliiroseovarius subalbicans TaxID=2925840 RepID=UPI001F589C1D|nr:hypothetical protein [Aliiroseovarius subalbicans]MCI2400775.1 hypothetical protein [Aliiroseovarius subalbicans]